LARKVWGRGGGGGAEQAAAKLEEIVFVGGIREVFRVVLEEGRKLVFLRLAHSDAGKKKENVRGDQVFKRSG
jgi:hypothetical protein